LLNEFNRERERERERERANPNFSKAIQITDIESIENMYLPIL
jgi:hypothetical protein